MSSYLSEINVACSPYISRSQRAIDFYKANYDQSKETNCSVFLALAFGPDKNKDWSTTDGSPTLPSLNTFDLIQPYKFIRYNKMFFVKSDVDGKLNVGGLKWSRINYGSSLDEYYINVRNQNARWLYIEFKTTDSTDTTNVASDASDGNLYTKQIGIYAYLKLADDVTDYSPIVFTEDQIKKFTSSSNENRVYDGILTLIQNKEMFPSNKNSTYSFVLEF